MEKESINNNFENEIFRCPKCFNVPLMSLKYNNNKILIHTLCSNKHNLYTSISDFLTKKVKIILFIYNHVNIANQKIIKKFCFVMNVIYVFVKNVNLII